MQLITRVKQAAEGGYVSRGSESLQYFNPLVKNISVELDTIHPTAATSNTNFIRHAVPKVRQILVSSSSGSIQCLL